MTFVPENATLCGCAADLPLDSSERVGGLGPGARRGCPDCGGRGWYMEGSISIQSEEFRQRVEAERARKRARGFSPIGREEDSTPACEAPLIPDAWTDLFRAEAEAFRRDFAAQLDREFLYGDGSPPVPIPTAPLRARLRYRVWKARVDARRRIADARRRYVVAPRERLGKRIAPTLLTDEEAEERYGDW